MSEFCLDKQLDWVCDLGLIHFWGIMELIYVRKLWKLLDYHLTTQTHVLERGGAGWGGVLTSRYATPE